MELHEALNQIAVIQQRLAESELFRGYRALPVAASGVFALTGGWLQALALTNPLADVRAYVLLWSIVAAVSVAAAGLTIVMRDFLAGPPLTRALTWVALRQFVPCILSGVAVTAAIIRLAPDAAWLLPGLWQLFFAQGVFASCRILPRSVYLVAAFYLISGSLHFVVFQGSQALSPLAMAAPFGFGQLLTASILYWTLERRDAVEIES